MASLVGAAPESKSKSMFKMPTKAWAQGLWASAFGVSLFGLSTFCLASWLDASWLDDSAIAQEIAQETTQTDDAEFWLKATPVIKAQVKTIEALAVASQTQDPKLVRRERNKLILHLSNVERLLRRYPIQGECPTFADDQPYKPNAKTPAVNAFAKLASGKLSKLETYCGLQLTRLELLPVLNRLAIRSQVLQREGDVLEPVPLVDGSDRAFDPYKDWYWQSGKLPHEQPLIELRAQRHPPLELAQTSPIVTFPYGQNKTAIANYQVYPRAFSPASTLPHEFLTQASLIALRSPLRTEPYIPSDPMQTYHEAIDFREYEDFLASYTGTGFALMSPGPSPDMVLKLVPRPETDKLANPLLAPPVDLPSPTWENAKLTTAYLADPRNLFDYGQIVLIDRDRAPGVEPQFSGSPMMLTLSGDRFLVQGQELDYGFIEEIGDIELDDLGGEFDQQSPEAIPAALWQYFWKYQPPTAVETIKMHRRLYATEKLQVAGNAIGDRQPVQLNRTYLMRTISYDLPKAVTSPRTVVSRNFPYVEVQNSSDTLVAFRPIRERNGRYTILWRILKRFPSPKIDDLGQYAQIR